MINYIKSIRKSYCNILIDRLMNNPNKEWNWMDCNLTLKRASKKNQNQIYQILESQYTVMLEQEQTQTELNIEITMEKKINSEESGFIWHKSWNIPSIEVKISRRDLNAIKSQLNISRVYCQITSGYPMRKMIEFFLQEVTLEGETRKQIGTNGVARFTNLKFSQTSFSHQRNKFSLILIIFAKNEERSRSIIKSFISMPIYVDSRKQARKKIPVNHFLADIIPIEDFQEDLEIRHQDKKALKLKPKNKRKDFLPDEQKPEEDRRRGKYLIEYTLSGFVRYYISANIRNKIKHPFYFCYHFDNLLTFFYNRQINSNLLDLLKYLEKPLKNDNRKIIFLALEPSKEQKCQETLEDFKKKFISLFESWKFHFIEVAIKNSLYFTFMQQEKIGSQKIEEKSKGENCDELNSQNKDRKWVQASKEELFEAYCQYFASVEQRQINNQNQRNSNDSESHQIANLQNSPQNQRKYEHFELHQTICIQKAFNNQFGHKKAKLEEAEREDEQ